MQTHKSLAAAYETGHTDLLIDRQRSPLSPQRIEDQYVEISQLGRRQHRRVLGKSGLVAGLYQKIH
jgi:hypothetical protein